MKSAEDEFIAQMREQLRGHEEAYVPGAWERFDQRDRKSRRLVLWARSAAGAAAVLLMGFGIFLYQHQQAPKSTASTVLNSKQQNSGATKDGGTGNTAPHLTPADQSGNPPEISPSEDSYDVEYSISASKGTTELSKSRQSRQLVKTVAPDQSELAYTLSSAKATEKALNPPIAVSSQNETPVQHALSSKTIPSSEPLSKNQIAVKSPVAPAGQKEEVPKKSFEEFLKEESVRAQSMSASNKKRADKWEMGVMVAPSFGNAKRLNMGYGLSMAYVLSDKVSISSGLAYNEMGASKNAAKESPAYAAPAMVSLASSSRSLQSVDARLTGIDIPLEIKYKFSKALYANVGLSAFAVLNQKQQNNFIENNVEPAFAGFSNNADATFRTVVVSRKISEDIPKEEVKEERYLGFYNFSFGYQQKVFGGKSFAIEPFVKLPVKEFSRENLYLIGTGVKLRFDF